MTVKIGQRVGWVMLGRITSIGALLSVNIFLSRLLGENDYGRFQQLWLMVSVSVPIFVCGLPLSLSYFLPRLDNAERHQFMRQTGFILFFSGGLYSLILAVAVSFLVHDPLLVSQVRVIAIIGFGLISSSFLEFFLINYHRHRLLFVVLAIISGSYVILIFASFHISPTVNAIILAFVGMALIRLSISWALLFRLAPLNRQQWRFDRLRNQWRFSLPVGLRDGIEILSKWADKLMITSFFSPAEFARYFNGAMEAPIIDLIVQSTLKVLMPDFAAAYHRHDYPGILALLHLISRRIALIIFPMAVFFIVCGPDLMVLLFGENYRLSGGYFRVFSLVIFSRVVVSATLLYACGHSQRVFYGTLLDIFIIFALSFLLMPVIGLYGPALASVIGTYTQTFYYLFWVGRALRQPIRALLPWQRLRSIFLISAISGGVSFFVKFSGMAMVDIGLSGLVFSVLYGAGSYYLGIFDRDEIQYLRRLLHLRHPADRGRDE